MLILEVDDNIDADESLDMFLRLEGHEVRVVHDGPAALEVAPAFCPEVVLLDIGLPKGMNGYELTRRLRTLPQLQGTLFLAVSGYGPGVGSATVERRGVRGASGQAGGFGPAAGTTRTGVTEGPGTVLYGAMAPLNYEPGHGPAFLLDSHLERRILLHAPARGRHLDFVVLNSYHGIRWATSPPQSLCEK